MYIFNFFSFMNFSIHHCESKIKKSNVNDLTYIAIRNLKKNYYFYLGFTKTITFLNQDRITLKFFTKKSSSTDFNDTLYRDL